MKARIRAWRGLYVALPMERLANATEFSEKGHYTSKGNVYSLNAMSYITVRVT